MVIHEIPSIPHHFPSAPHSERIRLAEQGFSHISCHGRGSLASERRGVCGKSARILTTKMFYPRIIQHRCGKPVFSLGK